MPNMTKMWGSGDPFRFLIHAQLFFEHQVSNDWTRAIRRDDSTPHRGFSLKRCRVKVVIACHSSSAKGLLGAFTKLVDSGKDHTFAANLVLMWVWDGLGQSPNWFVYWYWYLLFQVAFVCCFFIVSHFSARLLYTLLCRSKMVSDCWSIEPRLRPSAEP